MLRIKTKFGEGYYVHTIPFTKGWITCSCIAGACTSFESNDLLFAGRTHLDQAVKVKEEYDLLAPER